MTQVLLGIVSRIKFQILSLNGPLETLFPFQPFLRSVFTLYFVCDSVLDHLVPFGYSYLHTSCTDALVLLLILCVFVLSNKPIYWETSLYPIVYLEFLICIAVVLRGVIPLKISLSVRGFAHRKDSTNDWWLIEPALDGCYPSARPLTSGCNL